jgi:hypothetical protein
LREGSFSHYGNSLRVSDQPNGARGEPLVRATIGMSAPFQASGDDRGLEGDRVLARDGVLRGDPAWDLEAALVGWQNGNP